MPLIPVLKLDALSPQENLQCLCGQEFSHWALEVGTTSYAAVYYLCEEHAAQLSTLLADRPPVAKEPAPTDEPTTPPTNKPTAA